MGFSCIGGKAGRHTLKRATCQGILFGLARLGYPVKAYLVLSTTRGSMSRFYFLTITLELPCQATPTAITLMDHCQGFIFT